MGQYYQFLRLGRSGYARICTNLLAVAARLAKGVKALARVPRCLMLHAGSCPDAAPHSPLQGVFRLLSDDHSLPLVAFCFLPLPDGRQRPYDEFQLADKLKERGWVLPAYRMAPNASHVQLLRAVIREDRSMTMGDALLKDIAHALAYLEHHFGGDATGMAAAPAGAAAALEPAPAAVPSSAAFREAHAPHRLHRAGRKKHPGVC